MRWTARIWRFFSRTTRATTRRYWAASTVLCWTRVEKRRAPGPRCCDALIRLFVLRAMRAGPFELATGVGDARVSRCRKAGEGTGGLRVEPGDGKWGTR